MAFTICWFNMLGRLKQCTGHTNTTQERQGWYLLMAWPWANHFPFLCFSFFPLIICLVYLDPRHFGAAGSPALCCEGTHMRLSSMMLNWFQKELHSAQSWCKVVVGNGVSRELSSKKGQIARETRACFSCKRPWSKVFVEEEQCCLCSVTHLSVCIWKFDFLSPLDSINLLSGDWFQGQKAYGWCCACSWTWDLM